MKKVLVLLLLCFFVLEFSSTFAQQSTKIPLPKIGLDISTSDSPEDISTTLQLLLLLTILSLAPSILIMTTSYLRIIIVFHFLRSALGTMQMPPNQLLAGIALFITFFIMTPAWNEVNDKALTPYMDGKITLDSAYESGIVPLREFMLAHTRNEDMALFMGLSELEEPETPNDLPVYILIPIIYLKRTSRRIYYRVLSFYSLFND